MYLGVVSISAEAAALGTVLIQQRHQSLPMYRQRQLRHQGCLFQRMNSGNDLGDSDLSLLMTSRCSDCSRASITGGTALKPATVPVADAVVASTIVGIVLQVRWLQQSQHHSQQRLQSLPQRQPQQQLILMRLPRLRRRGERRRRGSANRRRRQQPLQLQVWFVHAS